MCWYRQPRFAVHCSWRNRSRKSSLLFASALKVLPRAPKTWIAAGGGTRNPTLMGMLKERLAPATVESADAVGWSADALEAQAFAYLAVRSLSGLPLTFPSTTGAPRALTGGVLAKPSLLDESK